LADIIRNRDATGQIAKWAMEMGVHTIKYEPRKAIKSQALADFLVDWQEIQLPEPSLDMQGWTLHFDGSKNFEGASARVILTAPKGDKLKYALQLNFATCTNNMAKYEALLHGMRVTKEMSVNRLRCFGNSNLVASQVSGTCDASDPTMIKYRRAIDQLGGSFLGHSVEWIDQRKNEDTDTLARLASTRQPPPADIFLDILNRPSVLPPTEIELGTPTRT
jgi:ribonuclease HI